MSQLSKSYENIAHIYIYIYFLYTGYYATAAASCEYSFGKTFETLLALNGLSSSDTLRNQSRIE